MTTLEELQQQANVLMVAVSQQSEAFLGAPMIDKPRMLSNLVDLATRARAAVQDWLDHPAAVHSPERRKMAEGAASLDDVIAKTTKTLEGVAEAIARVSPKA